MKNILEIDCGLIKIQEYYGDKQIDVMIEEMAELTQALCKLKRTNKESKQLEIIDNIKEELVDVNVMWEQIAYYFGMTQEEFTERKEYKINRQIKRICEEA